MTNRANHNDPVDIAWLNSTAGQELLQHADALLTESPQRAAIQLRRHASSSAHSTLALAQAQLRRDAVTKFGADASRMYFTRESLEQASRSIVSQRRARRMAQAGISNVIDLCCGIGGDALPLAAQGITVTAVDLSPETTAIMQANADNLGLGNLIEAVCDDALSTDVSGHDGLFCDPARRIAGKRIFDPARYSPPLAQIWARATDKQLAAYKVAPGIAHDDIPSNAEAEWVSVDGDVVEATLWHGVHPGRRASVISNGIVHELTGDGSRDTEVGDVGEYLHEPDGAVIRSRLVADIASELDAHTAHPHIAYLYTNSPVASPFVRSWRIRDILGFNIKHLRSALRQRGIGRLEIKKRGADVVPDRLRKELKLSGDNEAVLIVTRTTDRHIALLCDPLDTSE